MKTPIMDAAELAETVSTLKRLAKVSPLLGVLHGPEAVRALRGAIQLGALKAGIAPDRALELAASAPIPANGIKFTVNFK